MQIASRKLPGSAIQASRNGSDSPAGHALLLASGDHCQSGCRNRKLA
jgi:hypothetical protein